MATISNLYVDAGATYSNIITVTAANGQALNLTGYTVASQIRKSYQSSTAYAFTATVYDAATGAENATKIQGRIPKRYDNSHSRPM